MTGAAAAPPRRDGTGRRGTGTLVLALAGLSALGQFASNVYLPSIPAIARDLGVPVAGVQATLAVFLAAFALGQLAAGPLADRLGRRAMIRGGLGLFLAGTVAGLVADDLLALHAARVVQGLGAAATIVAGRAVARDLFEGAELARVLALVTIAFALVPGLTPLLGGGLEALGGWRWTFAATAAFGLLVALGARGITEGARPITGAEATQSTPHVYLGLLGDRRFRRPALASAAAFAAMSAFFAGSPVVFLERLGVTPLEYGLYPPLAVSGFVVGGLAVRRLAGRVPPDRLMALGARVMVLAAAAMTVLPMAGLVHKHAFNAGMVAFVSGLGVVLPLAVAAALTPFGHVAGRAAAMLGFLQMGGGALGALAVPAALTAFPVAGFAVVMLAAVGTGAAWLALDRG